MSPGDAGGLELAFLGGAGVAILAAAALVAARIGPVWFIAPGIALSIFSGNWDHLGLPLGPDRLLVGVGIAVALWRVLDPRRPERVTLAPVHLVLVALGAFATCSAIWSGALGRSSDLYLLLDKLGILPFLVFLLAPAIFPTARERRVMLGALAVVATYLGIVGVLEVAGADGLVVPAYIVDPSLGIHADRVRGPFLESSGMGLALYAGVVTMAMVAATTRSQAVRVWAAVVGAMLVVGIVGTVTRHVWLGALLGSAVALGLVPALRRYLPAAIAAGAVLVIGALLLAPGLEEQASTRAASERPVWDRLNSNRAALNMFEERPLLGQGWGAFAERGDEYYRIVPEYPLTHVGAVHNVALSYLAEIGAVGALLWLASIALAMAPALRRARAPGLEVWRIGLIAVVVDWAVTAMLVPLGYAYPNLLLWTWAGIVWAGTREPAPAAERAVVPWDAADPVRVRRFRPAAG